MNRTFQSLTDSGALIVFIQNIENGARRSDDRRRWWPEIIPRILMAARILGESRFGPALRDSAASSTSHSPSHAPISCAR
jgi:hypothetical protein